MDLPQVRLASHPDDPEARLDHGNVWGSSLPHTHVIREAWNERDKNALANHIDRYHAPKEVDPPTGVL